MTGAETTMFAELLKMGVPGLAIAGLLIAIRALWLDNRALREQCASLTDRYVDRLEKLHGKNTELAENATALARSLAKRRSREGGQG